MCIRRCAYLISREDKASMDFESQEEGFMAKILVEEGAHDVPINTVCRTCGGGAI